MTLKATVSLSSAATTQMGSTGRRLIPVLEDREGLDRFRAPLTWRSSRARIGARRGRWWFPGCPRGPQPPAMGIYLAARRRKVGRSGLLSSRRRSAKPFPGRSGVHRSCHMAREALFFWLEADREQQGVLGQEESSRARSWRPGRSDGPAAVRSGWSGAGHRPRRWSGPGYLPAMNPDQAASAA